ncbi:hypothetical protein SAMN05216525_12745 [Bradyrhizobium sp. Gha]|nr:hypothetical protein SAMN05216525_12745 [Bradyrhizobium sp. Gha]
MAMRAFGIPEDRIKVLWRQTEIEATQPCPTLVA